MWCVWTWRDRFGVERQPLCPGSAGMLIVEDLIHTLQWQAFWTHKDKATYPVLEQMKELQSMLAANERCPEQFEVINGQVEQLHQDFLRRNVRLSLSFAISLVFGCSWFPSSKML